MAGMIDVKLKESIDLKVGQLCDLWIFKVKFWNSCISGMGGRIDVKQKVNQLDAGLWPHPWPWPWIFKVKLLNRCILVMDGLIDME